MQETHLRDRFIKNLILYASLCKGHVQQFTMGKLVSPRIVKTSYSREQLWHVWNHLVSLCLDYYYLHKGWIIKFILELFRGIYKLIFLICSRLPRLSLSPSCQRNSHGETRNSLITSSPSLIIQGDKRSEGVGMGGGRLRGFESWLESELIPYSIAFSFQPSSVPNYTTEYYKWWEAYCRA